MSVLRPLFLVMFCLGVALTGFSRPAQAALRFCNRTQQALEAAIGYRGMIEGDKESWISEGWWRIEPGQCSRVYDEPLEQRFYFYYALPADAPNGEKGPLVWSGKYQFCADTKAFRIEGDGECETRGYQTRGFQQVDLGTNTRDYVLDFKDGNADER